MSSVAPARVRRVLTIAGSDAGGGAGIQADLKAFARCGVHGMTAITAITAQNTVGVEAIQVLTGELVAAQIEAVVSDLGVDAVKTGMLGHVEVVEAVAAALRRLDGGVPIVVDPVLAASTGTDLLDADARAAVVELLLPLATVATPNAGEAAALTELRPGERQELADLARAVHALGPHAVVVTGGDREPVADMFFDGTAPVEIGAARVIGGASHGSGCTHSAVLAAQLALGRAALEAARIAQRITIEAIRDGRAELGGGEGPVDVLGAVGWSAGPAK